MRRSYPFRFPLPALAILGLEGITKMDGAILYVDRSRVRTGKVEEVKAAIRSLVGLVEPLEPQLLAYAFYLDEAAEQMTVVAVHPNAASMELHMDVGAPGFRRFEGLVDLYAIEVYGVPTQKVREQLEAKARLLGASARITIQSQYAGFTRAALLAAP